MSSRITRQMGTFDSALAIVDMKGYSKPLTMSIQRQIAEAGGKIEGTITLTKTANSETDIKAAEIPAEIQDRLRSAAAAAAEHAYAPYSRFRVGAALLLQDGAVVTGCNVEICSFRLTSCAEQSAIARAVAELGPGIRVRAVAVANLNHAASMPCGACRQTLAEFGGDQMLVLYPGEAGTLQQTTLGALLPHAFRGEYIG